MWGHSRATTWTVKFTMAKAAQGTAVLRISLAGADGGGPGGSGLAIGVNGQEVGSVRPVATTALRYNSDKGVWYQYTQRFDAALLKAGENSVTFTVPAGDVTSGVVWDYVRLELNDGSKPYPPPPDNGRPDYPAPADDSKPYPPPPDNGRPDYPAPAGVAVAAASAAAR